MKMDRTEGGFVDLKAYLKQKAALVDEAIERFLPAPDTMPTKLHQAMRY